MSTDRSCPCPAASATVSPPQTPAVAVQTHDRPQSESVSPPTATYEEVASDERVFMETLVELHRSLGTKFSVPTIGGKPLDLHRLFLEVTSRGGLEKVIRDRRWKDVISTFSFPSTITSASFVLRKYYISLLQHYEQVYFFRNKKCKISPTAPVVADTVCAQSEASLQTPISTQVESNMEDPIPENSQLRVGCRVAGKISGKFENGYIVTANFGSESFNGVLYHVPQTSTPTMQNLPSEPASDQAKKRSRKTVSDASHPKINKSGYDFFFAENYARIKPLYAGKERMVSEQLGRLWNKLTESEKEVYQSGVKIE